MKERESPSETINVDKGLQAKWDAMDKTSQLKLAIGFFLQCSQDAPPFLKMLGITKSDLPHVRIPGPKQREIWEVFILAKLKDQALMMKVKKDIADSLAALRDERIRWAAFTLNAALSYFYRLKRSSFKKIIRNSPSTINDGFFRFNNI